ncbi:MAG: TldD/PmbA family protein [Deltaproteobacteria bacterium]|nr:MAG: TldD/PmbA family protein [Deltaproteobacteria bacterium]
MKPEEVFNKVTKELKARAVEGYEIYLAKSRNLAIEVRKAEIESLKSAETMGVSLRVLRGRSLGFSYSTELNNQSLKKMVSNAVEGSEQVSSDPHLEFPSSDSSSLPDLEIFDENLIDIPLEEKLLLARELEEAARAYDPRVKKIHRATYHEGQEEVWMRNSRGLERHKKATLASCNIMAIATQNGESQVGWDLDFNHFFTGLKRKEIGVRAARKAVDMLGAKSIKTTKVPIILENSAACELLGTLAPSFLAESVQKKRSTLAGKMNQLIFSSLLNITDDGLYPGGVATAPFDAEGVERKKTPLIVEGRLVSYLYDIHCANREGVNSTGNSTRPSLKLPPQMGISNLFIEKGTASFERLLSDLGTGLLITELLGVHTADPISGDFSVGATGHWVEKGKRIFPVKEIAFSGNLIQLFRKVDQVGNDLRLFGPVGSPSLMLKEMTISGE